MDPMALQEPLDVREAPGRAMGKVAELWRPTESGRVVCTACARYCKIGEGQVGLCGIRGVHEGKLWLYTYGKVITGHVDPIEKKPVSHYRPGSKIFSIATTGCNWLCHPAGTQILMADASTKPVEEIRAGDALWSAANDLRTVPDIVTEAGHRRASVLRAVVTGQRDPLLGTPEHPVFTARGWVALRSLKPNDSVLVAQEGIEPEGWNAKSLLVPNHGPIAHPGSMRAFWRLTQGEDRPHPSFRWAQVREISQESRRESVFSFECVPFHNYVASNVLVHNCKYCFLPGTLVLTERGHEPIERVFGEAHLTANPEIRTLGGRLALTHRGRWRRIRKAFEHLYVGRVLSIRPYYLPGFECTPDHRIYGSIGGAPVRSVKANDLKVGDFLAIPRPRGSSGKTVDVVSLLRSRASPAYRRSHRLTIRQGRVRWSSERGSGLPVRLTVTPDVARLLGYYCAEGSVSWHPKRPNSGSVWFSLGGHEQTRIRDVARLLSTAFRVRVRKVRQDNRVAVIAPGASLTAFFEELCGNSSATKRVPEVILQSTNRVILKEFLTGYLNGDGYVTRSGNGQFLGSSSVSPALTYGVAQVFLTLGDVPKVYHAENPAVYEIEGRTVNRANDVMLRLRVEQASLEPERTSWTTAKVRVVRTREFFLIPIRSIEEKEYAGPVYNIEVDEDHSYTANLLAVANCQNYDISQRRKIEGIDAQPEDIVRMTLEQGCQGLAYTYNQPTIFIEFARDIGILARKAGLMNIFVSNGYDTPEVVEQMKPFLDCITVDFKGSGETQFVRKFISIPNADPIFSTLKEIRDKTKVHTEITDLIVPQVGDNLDAARVLSKFVYDELGPDTPIHFLRFHPDYKMMDLPWTPVETLEKHCQVAKEAGLRYVYIGNVPGHPLEHTYCPSCGAIAVRRYGFDITGWELTKDNRCKKCDYKLPIYGSLEKTAKDERYYSVLSHR